MAIELTCACGKFLQLPDESAGELGQCPACGRVLQMPARGAASPGAVMLPGDALRAITAETSRTAAKAGWTDDAIVEGPAPGTGAARLNEWGEIGQPSYKLWSPGAIGVVAFLCGPVGPFLMISINYARLGMRSAAWTTAALGLLTTAAVLAISYALPESSKAGMLLGVPLFVGIWLGARTAQGGLYDAHLRAGGEAASGWSAAGLGVLGVVVFLGAAIAVAFAYDTIGEDRYGTRVDFGGGQEIYYTQGATEADAHALGDVLRRAGFFDGRAPAAVQVAREGERVIVAFIVQPRALNDLQDQQFFRGLGVQASAQAFAGRPVEVRLCNEFFEVKKKL